MDDRVYRGVGAMTRSNLRRARCCFAMLAVLLPGAMSIRAGAASASMEVTNTSKYPVYAVAEKAGAGTIHLYIPSMGRETVYATGPYVLKGYAVVNGLKIDLPNLPLLLNPSAPLSVIISESGKNVVWGSRAGNSSGAWY